MSLELLAAFGLRTEEAIMKHFSPAATRMTALIVPAQRWFIDLTSLGWAVDRYPKPQ